MIRARFDRWVKDRTLAACFGAASAAARMSRTPLPSTANVAVFTYWCGELSALSFLAHVTGTSRRAAQADRDAAAAGEDLDDCDAEPTPARGTPLGGLGVKPLGGAAVATGEEAGGQGREGSTAGARGFSELRRTRRIAVVGEAIAAHERVRAEPTALLKRAAVDMYSCDYGHDCEHDVMEHSGCRHTVSPRLICIECRGGT